MQVIESFNAYQDFAEEFKTYPKQLDFVYPALGLAGEAGECVDKIKKVLRDDNGVLSAQRKLDIAYELGDVLWYLSDLSTAIGFTLQDIAQMNYEKLCGRKDRGTLKGSGDDR